MASDNRFFCFTTRSNFFFEEIFNGTKWKLIVPGIIAGAVAIGGIAAYFYLKVIPAREGTSPVASAKIVPDEAWMAGYVDITSDSWEKLKDFGTPEAQDLVFGGSMR
ncbi:DUF3352 domain-containing protein [Acaryochloris sp. CCMEE 5410]|uniref:DUF3352 domain-containing protein n=1 Tax=Acaryochloris sp. CCMEE 5410 TaxID=310037 RepID=UPI0021D2685B|nr:DUF3352 domain-containing protein [Acaryochloris sp. CCMEE 5410]